MKRIIIAAALLLFAQLGATAADSKATAPAKKLTCCQEADAKSKTCANLCCITAHRKGESCTKCNPGKEDLAILKKAAARNSKPVVSEQAKIEPAKATPAPKKPVSK